jgi:tubulin-specific chaperone A
MAAGQQQETAVLSVLLNGEQAKNEIAELEKKAEELKEQIKALGKDDKNRKELVRQLQEVKGTVKLLETGVVDVDRVLNNLSTSKPKELNAVLRALKQQLQFSNIERGSAEWNRLQEAIRKVKQELQNVSEESKLAESRMSRMSNGFNKYFGMVTAGIAAITGLSLTFRKLAEDVAKLDDVYADVMKTTGMTKDEVLALNEAFKKMDTRTARGNLNAIAEEGGRIGIAKEEILSFVKAMDIANVALGDSFKGGAEEIANTLGKLKFLFEDTKNMGVEKAYLAIGSAINELGANGVASEVNIAEFAKRLGSMPAALKPTAAEAMALGAAFEESASRRKSPRVPTGLS